MEKLKKERCWKVAPPVWIIYGKKVSRLQPGRRYSRDLI
jgi:hypothetical protein